MKLLKAFFWTSVAFQAFFWLAFAPLVIIREKNLLELPVIDATLTNIHPGWVGGKRQRWYLFGDLVFDNRDKHCVFKSYDLGPIDGTLSFDGIPSTRAAKVGVTPHSCGDWVLYPFSMEWVQPFLIKWSVIGNLLVLWLVLRSIWAVRFARNITDPKARSARTRSDK